MTKFVRNQKVPFEEGLRCEFKAFENNPVQQIRDYIDIYVVSFFNIGAEGSIYFGVRDGGEAVGVSLDRQRRDEVRKDIGQKLGRTRPPIHPPSYEIIFHDLFDGGGNPIADRPIVEVKLKPTSPRREVYFTNGTVYIKTPGGREQASGERLLVLQAKINEELKAWEVESQKAEQEQKQREAEAQNVQGEVPSKKKPRQKSTPTPFDNPYNFAVTAKEDIFKGREVEIGRLQSAIRSGTHTVIYGLQRMGKTSLVKETLRRVNENCIFAEVDFHNFRGRDMTYGGTLDVILRSIAREISPAQAREVDDGITMYINSLVGTNKHRMLDDFSILLKRTLSHTRRKVVLFLDEFSELCQAVDSNEIQLQQNPNRSTPQFTKDMPVDASLIDWFSALMKDDELLRKMTIIFAVRPFVAQYADDTPLAILKLVRSITLGYLSEQEAKALMVEPLKGKIAYEEGSIDYLYNLTAGHPYLIQCFFQEIIDQILQDGRNRIEKRDITDLEQEFVSKEHNGHFMVLDSDYSVESVRSDKIAKQGRGVLAVIAHLGGEPEDDGWVPGGKMRESLSHLGMPENEIYDILAKLRGAQIIEEKADKEKLEYRIQIPLLRKRYISQNMYQRHFQQKGS